MLDLTDKQAIYNEIKIAANKDGKALWPLIGKIHTHIHKLTKENNTLREEHTQKEKKKEEGLDPSNLSDLTDAELRQRVKGLLVARLDEGTLSASDIGQLKDIFGLASKTDDLSIEVVDYSNAIIDCPHCKKNVHQTSTK
tara:strand:- start:57 stop:476 length:420 start_codon:yes stop_codon:yes gene_type:complete